MLLADFWIVNLERQFIPTAESISDSPVWRPGSKAYVSRFAESIFVPCGVVII